MATKSSSPPGPPMHRRRARPRRRPAAARRRRARRGARSRRSIRSVSHCGSFRRCLVDAGETPQAGGFRRGSGAGRFRAAGRIFRPMIRRESASAAEPPRDLRHGAVARLGAALPGLRRGPLMDGYLTVRHACPACGTELHHHRADDGPAWATILITGHLMAPLMLIVFIAFRPEAWQMALGFSAVFVALSLYLLPRLKGAFVAAAVGQADARLRRRGRTLAGERLTPDAAGPRRRDGDPGAPHAPAAPQVLMGQRGARRRLHARRSSSFPAAPSTRRPRARGRRGRARARDRAAARGRDARPSWRAPWPLAAVRELWEETGLMLGRPDPGAAARAVPPSWRGFSRRRPRARTPRRCASSSARSPRRAGRDGSTPASSSPRRATLAGRATTVAASGDELAHLQWLDLAAARALPLPFITEVVLSELEALLAGPGARGRCPSSPSGRRGRRSACSGLDRQGAKA